MGRGGVSVWGGSGMCTPYACPPAMTSIHPLPHYIITSLLHTTSFSHYLHDLNYPIIPSHASPHRIHHLITFITSSHSSPRHMHYLITSPSHHLHYFFTSYSCPAAIVGLSLDCVTTPTAPATIARQVSHALAWPLVTGSSGSTGLACRH